MPAKTQATLEDLYHVPEDGKTDRRRRTGTDVTHRRLAKPRRDGDHHLTSLLRTSHGLRPGLS
jgi:hypothetical protein